MTAEAIAKGAGELADIIKATPFGAYDNPPALILVVPPSIGKLCEATKLFFRCSVPMERFGEVLENAIEMLRIMEASYESSASGRTILLS